ncbi:hypothetical protein G6F40_015401 [Rhizopus arrhizus]|nr:hypothetical protein G6F40_015401 [Rhizopus arrhizus]
MGRRVIVDAVSAFGALPLNLAALPAVDAVVLTANKCLEGLPGAAFVVARIDRLEAARGNAGSWSLDLADIYLHTLVPNAGPRFTPPAPTLAALAVASLAGRAWALASFGLSITHVWPDARELAWIVGVLVISAVAGLVPALLAYRRTLADGLSPGG